MSTIANDMVDMPAVVGAPELAPKRKEDELRERFAKFMEKVCKKSPRQIADEPYRQPVPPNGGGRVA